MNGIKLLVSDVDGVLTDGGLIYNSDGRESKVFNVKDGMICKYLQNNNIKLAIITGRQSEVVKTRFTELRFDHIKQGIENKLDCLNNILDIENLTLEEVAYIGDDLNDLSIIEKVKLSGCPNDAVEKVKQKVDYICKIDGGKGAFREFAEYVLNLQKIEF